MHWVLELLRLILGLVQRLLLSQELRGVLARIGAEHVLLGRVLSLVGAEQVLLGTHGLSLTDSRARRRELRRGVHGAPAPGHVLVGLLLLGVRIRLILTGRLHIFLGRVLNTMKAFSEHCYYHRYRRFLLVLTGYLAD